MKGEQAVEDGMGTHPDRLCGMPRHLAKEKLKTAFFYVLLTVHLSIFISVFNQLYAQNLFENKFYFMPQHVSSTCARNMLRHEIKLIVKQILCIKLVKY